MHPGTSLATVSDPNEHDPPSSTAIGIAPLRPFDAKAFEKAVVDLLTACGVEESAHMRSTSTRVRALWQDRLLGGYGSDPAAVLGEGFADPRQDLVVIRGISVHGVCPHHLVPFRGVAHVAYLPGGRLHGFGRIARLVDALGHRFTYQEWLTRDVAHALVHHGHARGACCVVECEQLCLLLGEARRGEERVLTQVFAGTPDTDAALRLEVTRAVFSPTST